MSQELHIPCGSIWTCKESTSPKPMIWDKDGVSLGSLDNNTLILTLHDFTTNTNDYTPILVKGSLCYIDTFWWKLNSFVHVV